MKPLSWIIQAPLWCLFAASVAGFMGHLSWAFDMFAHFRVQMALAAAGLVVFHAIMQQKWAVRLAVALLIVNFALVAPYFSWTSSVLADPETKPLRVMSFNVLFENKEFDAILNTIAVSEADIVGLVELTPELATRLPELHRQYPYQYVVADTGHLGSALLSKLPFTEREMLHLGEAEFATLRGEFEIAGKLVSTLITHPLPPLGAHAANLRDTQLADISSYVQTLDTAVILMGDFNATPWSQPMRSLVRETGLHNTALGQGLTPTWFSSIYPFGIAIDHVLVSAEFDTLSHGVGSASGSDHYPIIAQLAVE